VEPVALRPLTFGEVLDTAFNLFKRNFGTVLVVSGVIMVPLTLLAAASTSGLSPDMSLLEDPNATPEQALAFFASFTGAVGAGALLQSLGAILVQAATTRIYSENYRGLTMGASEGLRTGLSRLPAMLGLTLVSTIGAYIGLIFCLAPGIWLWAAWGLSPAALISEHAGPFQSMKRSFELVKGSWWRVFGILIVTQILIGVISFVVSTPIQFTSLLGGQTAGSELPVSLDRLLGLNILLTGLVSAITLPFAAAVVVALYYDQRVRNEGYDLERLIDDLGEPPTGPGTSSSTDPTDPFGLG
jgi:hypothetical protein